MAEDKKTATKKRRPTAQKRDIQNLKRRMRNRMHKSKIKTASQDFEAFLKDSKDAKVMQEKLNHIFSLYDKGVKKGILKINQANRKKLFFTKLSAKA